MQSIDEILTDITSRTQGLIRKLEELSIENELLQKENRQLKQDILAKGEVNLFSSSNQRPTKQSEASSKKTETIQQQVKECIEEVQACMALVQKVAGEKES